ncbi:MAG: hypothetical protein SWO11_14520 [Thermodesulfobacteriota bacterium]|nr:hypothetical protein [Thermodesulfobacteriota bacterium]
MKRFKLGEIALTTIGAVFLLAGIAFAQDYQFGTNTDANLVNNCWADFVFDDNYKLPTLEEVESYIKVNKHLPGLPPEKKIREEGMDVSDILTRQMQKIEELTLYLIELNKENEALKSRITVIERAAKTWRKYGGK